MSNPSDDRAARYLDGELSVGEAEKFERALMEREVSRDLEEELFLRELLRTLPPETPPQELVSRIEISILDSTSVGAAARERSAATRATKEALGWMVRGPELALSGIEGATVGARESLKGMSSVRYSLGPLAFASLKRPEKVRPPRRPLWRRLLGL